MFDAAQTVYAKALGDIQESGLWKEERKPTTPQKAAGWRTEPPVSEPSASGAEPEETAAAEPPLEPPGTRERFQGVRVGKKAELSVEEPMANSSRLVFPRRGMPAARAFWTTVASSGGIYCSRKREAQVVRTPQLQILSFTARGTPARGCSASPRFRLSSTASASARAVSGFRVI